MHQGEKHAAAPYQQMKMPRKPGRYCGIAFAPLQPLDKPDEGYRSACNAKRLCQILIHPQAEDKARFGGKTEGCKSQGGAAPGKPATIDGLLQQGGNEHGEEHCFGKGRIFFKRGRQEAGGIIPHFDRPPHQPICRQIECEHRR